jgi:GT2 family glycosyltransferase/glycosyltransferase involved in cell wall biosynthesis
MLVTAARKAWIALREGRLSPSPLEWVRHVRQLSNELSAERIVATRTRAIPPAPPPGDPSDASTIPAVEGESLRLALAAFLNGTQRLRFDSPQPRLAVVITVHNRADLTLRCLRALAASTLPLQIVIVDNGSNDQTPKLLERLDGVRILRNETNIGFLRATNEGAKAATADLMLLLNSDTEVGPTSLAAAIETLESSASIGAVVALLTRRSTFRELGGFDERYAPAYYEDADYCVRLWQAGLRVVYEPRAVVRHAEFGSGAPANALSLQTERRAIFARTHGAWLERSTYSRGTSLLKARTRRRGGQRILFIEDRVPHERLGSGYPRALAITKALIGLGHHVTVFPLLVPHEAWDEAYADVPREAELWVGGGAAGLANLMDAHGTDYDTIIVSRPHNMRVVRHALPAPDHRPTLIYDAEAIFALRAIGRQKVRGRPVSLETGRQTVADEIALARSADLILAVSPTEQQHFVDQGLKRVMVLGHSMTPRPTPAAFADRNALLFVGAFVDRSSPNTDSLQWFIHDVLPALTARLEPGVRLIVAGRDANRTLTELHPAVELVGMVDDLEPLFNRARLFIAPTRFAAGLPAKAHQAAAFGVPIVATSLIAHQLGWRDGHDLLVADDPQQFVEQCVALYQESALWTRIRESALARVTEECAPDTFRATLARALLTAQRARVGDITTGVGPQSDSASR